MEIHVSCSEEEGPAERQLYMALSMIQKECVRFDGLKLRRCVVVRLGDIVLVLI